MSSDDKDFKIVSYLPYILNHPKYFRVREILHILVDYSGLKVEDYEKPMIFASSSAIKIAREVAEDPIKNIEKLYALRVVEDMMDRMFKGFYHAYCDIIRYAENELEDLEKFIDEVFKIYNEDDCKIEGNYFQHIIDRAYMNLL